MTANTTLKSVDPKLFHVTCAAHLLRICTIRIKFFSEDVDWFTPPLSWDGGTAGTTMQVRTVNLIKIGQEKSGSQFTTSHECNLLTSGRTINKADGHLWVAKSRHLRYAGIS